MSQPDHNAVFQAFYQWERDSFINVVSDLITGETRSFMPVENLKAYFQDNGGRKLNKILSLVFRDEEVPIESEVVLESYIAVFCILLHIGKAKYIEHFACYDELSDQRLPLDPASRPANFPVATDEPRFFERFCETQWTYCVPIFQRPMLNRHFEPHRLLPIIYRERVAVGGSAILYKIGLYGPYNKLLSDESRLQINDLTANNFVLKRYLSQDAGDYYVQELSCFKRLGPNASIVGFYGSYIHGTSYNILLEFADKGSLEEYFQKWSPPRTGEDIVKFWKGLFNIIKALEALHDIRGTVEGSQIFQGWHQDVKPENILVMSHGAISQFDWQFKLADFGLSHFTIKSSSEEEATAADSHGTRTYGAPECYRSDDMATRTISVKQGIDVWSLGCIYSEAAIWIADGYQGLLEYRRQRKAETDELSEFRGGDCFHDGHKVLKTVLKAHESIEDRLRKSDYITKNVLDRMVEEMLWTEERPKPKALRLKAEKILLLDRQRRLSSTRNEDIQTVRGEITQSSTYPPLLPPVQPQGWPWLSPPQQPHPTSGETLPLHGDGHQDEQYGSIISQGQGEIPPSMSVHAIGNSSWQQNTPPAPMYMHPSTQHDRVSNQIFGSQPWHWQGPQSSGLLKPDMAFQRGQYLSSTGSPDDGRGVLENSNSNPSLSRDGIAVSPVDRGDRSHTVSPIERGDRRNSVISSSLYTGQSSQPASISASTSISAPAIQKENTSSYASRSAGPPTPPTSANQLDEVSDFTLHISPQAQQNLCQDPAVSSAPSIQSHPPSPPLTNLPKSGPAHASENSSQTKLLTVTAALEWKKASKNKKQSPLPGVHLLDELKDRDHMFVIDDGASMMPHWTDVITAFEALSYLVKRKSPDGIELSFTIDYTTRRTKTTTELLKLLKEKRLERDKTDVSRRLRFELERYRREFHQNLAKSKSKRPMNIYVLTNGDWKPGCDPIIPIKAHIDWLIELKLKQGQCGIQFIGFGKDPKCLQRLNDLVSKSNLGLDIMDCTPWTGDVWKMLLGANDKTRFPSTSSSIYELS